MSTKAASGRNDANARGERLRHHELAVRDLERKCRQGARGRAIDHRSALARIIMRIVAGAFENLLLRDPYTDLASGMRADRRIGDYTLRRALLRDADQRRRIEPEQEHFVETRAIANDIGEEVHRPCQHRWAACRNVLRLKGRLTFAFDGDQHVPFFRPLVRRLRQDRAADSEIKAKDRCDREKIAARGAIDITAIAAATPAFPDLAHHSSRTGASNGLHSSYYSKSLRSSPLKRGPKHQSASRKRKTGCPRTVGRLRSETEIHHRHHHGLPIVDWPVTGSTAN